MNKTAKVVVWIIVIALIIWGIVSWSNKATAPVSTGPIKIGVVAPLTGDASVYGEPLKKMMEMAVAEINQAGGVSGRQLELITEDGKCNGKDAASATQKLISVDKVQVVIPACSGESLAALPIAETAKVAVISAMSSSPDLTGKSSLFARNFPSDATQGTVLANTAFTKKLVKKVAFAQEQTDYALGIYNSFKTSFEGLGGTITTKEEFKSDATDFRSVVAKLKASNPDAVFLDVQAPAVATRILKEMDTLKWKPVILVSDSVIGDLATVSDNKKILEGALGAEFGTDLTNPKFTHMMEAYKAKYGAEPPFASYAQTEYDIIFMIADAVKANGYDGVKIADWFHNVKDWDGASGKISIGSNGDRVGGHVAKVIKNGKVELLTP